MNSRRLMAIPSRAETNIFDTQNDSTRGSAAWKIFRGASAAAAPPAPTMIMDVSQDR